MPLAGAFSHQLALAANVLKNSVHIKTDPKMSKKMDLENLGRHFTGMLIHEGLTNPRITCEQVAQRSFGKGNHRALDGRVAMITGASGGLGLEHARVLLKFGCHVVFAVRNPVKMARLLQELQAKEELSGASTILEVDLGDLATIRPFVARFLDLGLPLNYLINNAGVMTPREFRPSAQGYETQFATNHLAHFLLTELLMPKLRETRQSGVDVRIVILSSVGSTLIKACDLDKMVPPAKETYNGLTEYGISKAMNLFHCRELQKRCAADGITCCAVHPGVINTGLTREGNPDSTMLYDLFVLKPFQKDIPQGAATQMYCTLSSEVPAQVKAGRCFYYNSAPQKPAGIAAPGIRDDLCAKLWDISESLVAPFR